MRSPGDDTVAGQGAGDPVRVGVDVGERDRLLVQRGGDAAGRELGRAAQNPADEEAHRRWTQ